MRQSSTQPSESVVAPYPCYFDGTAAKLFGWYHAPRSSLSAQSGVVLCNPYGFDEISAHRSIRWLAIGIAELGIPVLRFDFPGTGNSPGDEFDEDLMAQWIGAVGCAAEALKRHSRVDDIVIVGFGLGATLGYLASSGRDDVCGLIAVAPILSGRSYIRELRLLGGATRLGSQPETKALDVVESAGFVMTNSTAGALAAIDLRTDALDAPPRRMLIVERAGESRGERMWADRLAQAGVMILHETCTGYDEMVTNPQEARIPRQLFDRIEEVATEWCSKSGRSLDPSAEQPGYMANGFNDQSIELASMGASGSIRESIFVADNGSIFGILAEPGAGTPTAHVAILLLNSGSVHHVGPNRLWVTLSRRWASRGFTVLRLDLSGLGDSFHRSEASDNVSYSEHAVDDIEVALAALRKHRGVADCHLVGLCSGAYHAFKASVVGLPISSAIMINPLTYSWEEDGPRSLKAYEVIELAEDYRGKVLSGGPWRRLWRRELDLRMVSMVLLQGAMSTLVSHWQELRRTLRIPADDDLANQLERAGARGIGIKFVFAEGDPGHRLLRDLGGRRLTGMVDSGAITVNLVADADHTFTPLGARQRLIDTLDSLPPFRSQSVKKGMRAQHASRS